MSKHEYRFRLDVSGQISEVNPRRSDDYAFTETLVEGQYFYREKFEGTLIFQRSDYELIHQSAFDQQFFLYVDRRLKGEDWTLGWGKMSFWKTDCDIDEDNRTIRVEPTTEDRYKLLVEGMDKEFDLIELSPDTTQVQIMLRNMIQIYFEGSSVVTNYVGGVYWEQPVQQPVRIDAVNGITLAQYHFAFCKSMSFVPGQTTSGGTLSPDVAGEYDETRYRASDNRFRITEQFGQHIFIIPTATLDNYDDFGSIWQASNGAQFQFLGATLGNQYGFFQVSGSGAGSQFGTMTHVSGATNTADQDYSNWSDSNQFFRHTIRDVNPPTPLVERDVYLGDQIYFGAPFDEVNVERIITYRSLDDPSSETKVFTQNIYMRLLTNELQIGGVDTEIVPDDDFVTADSRYNRCIGIEYDGITGHDGNQSDATRWGRFQSDAPNFANQYFTQLVFPPSSGLGQTHPIARSEWTDCSYWIWFDATLESYALGGKSYTLKHAYKLVDVVRVLVQKIDPSLSHDEDAVHSAFLYGAGNSIRGSIKTPIIAPKTNLLAGEYDKPAQRARIKLSDVMRLVNDFYNAGWHISQSLQFIIEHAEYYAKGTSYSSPSIGADLTIQLEPKTQKNWAFRTNRYKYDKQAMPEQIRHKWMDEVADPFEGWPIEIISGYVEKGNLDERNLSPFTSDVDMMHAAGSNISNDGFAFFEAVTQEGDVPYVLPFVTQTIDSFEYRLQNGYAAMCWAHNQYWKYQLPATSIEMNLAADTASSVQKNRIQEIAFPRSEANSMQLVRTVVGDGKVQQQKTRLTSGKTDIILKHDNE